MSEASISARACLTLGRLLLRFGPVCARTSERLLSGAVNGGIDGAQGWARYAAALAASRRGDDEVALDGLRAASLALPHEAEVSVALALALANADEWQSAVEAGERALKFHEVTHADEQLWQMLAWGYLITGRYAYTRDIMQRMRDGGIGLAPIQLPLMLAQAIMLGQDPPIDRVRALLRQPRQKEAYWRFLEHLASTKHRDLAILLLSVLPPPAAVDAALMIAWRAAEQDRVDVVLFAAEALRRVELAPALSMATEAVAALVAGKYGSAIEHVREALRLWPDEAAVHSRAALVFFYSGDAEQARSEAARALMLGSNDAMSAALVAAAMADKGDLREGQSVFRTQRSGDALGVFLGDVVQARLLAAQTQERTAELLTRALRAVQDLPRWTRTARLREWGLAQMAEITAAAESPDARELASQVTAWFQRLPEVDQLAE